MAYRIRTNKTPDETRAEIGAEFDRWSKLAGGPVQWSEKRRGSGDRTAEIEYQLPGCPPVVLRHASQEDFRSNIRVLYLVIEALRLNEARGIGGAMREAYLALPAPSSGERDPYEVLGVRPDASRDVVEAAYRAQAKTAHPDHGGSAEAMAALNAAKTAVLG